MLAAQAYADAGATVLLASHDLDRAHRLASRVEAGYVWINGASTHHVGVPFGGVKQSGIGREGSKYGIDEWLETKYLCMGGI